MLRTVFGGNADSPARHTEYGDIYNHPYLGRDRIMPSKYGLDYYPLVGSYPSGFRAYNTPPILSVNENYYGRFAIQDQPPSERPLPWDREIKTRAIG